MLGRVLPAFGRSSALSRVQQARVHARVQTRPCSQCRSVRDWKENHAAWSRYTPTKVQERHCSQCRSVKEWKELHGAWSRLRSNATNPPASRSATFTTSARSEAKSRTPKDVNRQDPAFSGEKQASANTEPTKQPGPGKPAGKATPDETPEVPDELAKTGADPAQNTEPEEQPGPLPDLSKGIPSTLAAELEAAERARRGEPEESTTSTEAGSKAERARAATDFETSGDKRRKQVARYMIAAGVLGGLGFLLFQGRDWASPDEAARHADAPSGWSPSALYNRMMARWGSTVDYYNDPAFQKLLPDPDPAWAREYTLVLSLEDLLIHQEWSREHGWRLAKRPGVDYFLRYLSQYYELVIFTSIPSMSADPIIRKLDPYRIVMWPLFREATKYKNGEYIKDLSFLNRDLSKTVLVDTDAAHARAQPENAIILPKWKGDPKDRDLVALIPFLEYVAALQHPDLRKAISSFEGKSIPIEFAKREEAARQKFLADEANKRGKGRSGIGALSGAFGMSSSAQRPDGFEGVSEGLRKGKMLHDQIRERGQMAYQELEKQIRENGQKWLQEMAEEEEKAKAEYMKSMTSSVSGGMTGFFSSGPQKGGEAEKK